MELMHGGDLFDRIGRRKSYTENDARDLCRKMLESVRYCHENSVAHCDMKPKNLLLVSDDDDVGVKLADFGFATKVYAPGSLTKQCGTPFFVGEFALFKVGADCSPSCLLRRMRHVEILIVFNSLRTHIVAPEVLLRAPYDQQ